MTHYNKLPIKGSHWYTYSVITIYHNILYNTNISYSKDYMKLYPSMWSIPAIQNNKVRNPEFGRIRCFKTSYFLVST